MRLLRAQMPMRPEYIRGCRAQLTPWIYDFNSVAGGAFGSQPPDSDIGDLTIAAAGTPSTDTIPTTGTAFTSIDGDNSAGLTTVAARLCFRVSTSVNQTVGGFTNATRLIAVTFKGAQLEDNGTVMGATQLSTTSSNLKTWPSLSLPGPRLILLGFQHDSISSSTLPAGFTQVETIQSPALVVAISDDLYTSWSGTTASQFGNEPSITFVAAIRGAGGQFR